MDRGSCSVSYLLPSSSFQFISSCFQAMKFFPGEIRGLPAPPGVCHVYGGRGWFRWTEQGEPGKGWTED